MPSMRSKTIRFIASACALLLLAQPAFAKTAPKPAPKLTPTAVNKNALKAYAIYTSSYALAGTIKGSVGANLLVTDKTGQDYTVDVTAAKILDAKGKALKRAALKKGVYVQLSGKLARNSTGMAATAVRVVPIPTTP